MKSITVVFALILFVKFAQAQFVPAPPPPFYLPTFTLQQQEQVQAADIKHLDKMKTLQTQLTEKVAKLKLVLKEMELNKKEMTNLVNDIEKIKTEILLQEINHDQELKSVLNETQKVIFNSLPKPFLF